MKRIVGDILTSKDYYPGGSLQPGRAFSAGSYRYGFQGQEKDDEVKGSGNSINYKYRMHDARIGRFFAVDPLASQYVPISPYAFVANNPIIFIDIDGKELVDQSGKKVTVTMNDNGTLTWSSNATEDMKLIGAALIRTETGKEQLFKARDASVRISMKIDRVNDAPKEGNYGQTVLTASSESPLLIPKVNNDVVTPITIFAKEIDKMVEEGFRNGASWMTILSAGVAHEIQHATDDFNRERSAYNIWLENIDVIIPYRSRPEEKDAFKYSDAVYEETEKMTKKAEIRTVNKLEVKVSQDSPKQP